MSLFSNWYKKRKEDEDYEEILSALSSDIQQRQTKLSDIRLRERRSTLLVTIYALSAWVTYLALWYLEVLPSISGHQRRSGIEKAVRGVPVVVGPILILFTRRIVQIWYKSKGDKEEKTLRELLKQQHIKVEEIKKKTNYYSTRNLIERYDASPTNSPVQKTPMLPYPPSPVTPKRQNPVPLPNPTSQTPVSAGGKNQLPPPFVPPQNLPFSPPRKQWYDKLADALLGDDEHVSSPAASQYALICGKCFAHNGLVKEAMWEDTQYTCPKCGHFNPPARSRNRREPSPASAHTLAPTITLSPPSAHNLKSLSPLISEAMLVDDVSEGSAARTPSPDPQVDGS